MMSAITVPSGSMADVYWSAKGNVTLVRVFAGNLRVEKDDDGWLIAARMGRGALT